MAVSANSDWNPAVDVILKMALQHAGLLSLGRTPTATLLSDARDILDTFLKSMASDSAALIEMSMDTLPVSATVDAYVLPNDTVDVTFPMMVRETGTSNSQTQITQVVYRNYQEITLKELAGTPLRCYVERLETVTLRFWPVPEKAYTVSYQRQRLIRNAESGTTLDRQPNWVRGVAYQMAADLALASSIDLARVKYLQSMADGLLGKARGDDNESGDLQMILEGY
jgi:hypothetical protein